MLQTSHTYSPLRTLDDVHGPVSSEDAAATICGVLDSSPARVGPAMGVSSPVWCATVRAAVSDGVHRLSAVAGADGVRLEWDKDYWNKRFGLTWARAAASAASSSSKFWLTNTQNFFPIFAPVGVRRSGPCGPHAVKSTALIESLGDFSSSSESLASPALSSCFLQALVTLGGSLLAFWLTEAQSNRLSRGWKSLWSRRSTTTRRAVA